MDLNKLFEEFWYEYQSTVNFGKLWTDINDSQRYALIAADFVRWLIEKGIIKER